MVGNNFIGEPLMRIAMLMTNVERTALIKAGKLTNYFGIEQVHGVPLFIVSPYYFAESEPPDKPDDKQG
jgi:hypothetical protein